MLAESDRPRFHDPPRDARHNVADFQPGFGGPAVGKDFGDARAGFFIGDGDAQHAPFRRNGVVGHADDAHGNGQFLESRRHEPLADFGTRPVIPFDHRQIGGRDFNQGQIGIAVGGDDLGGKAAAVQQLATDLALEVRWLW